MLIIGSMAAYGMIIGNTRFNRWFGAVLVLGFIIPSQSTLIPLYRLLVRIGLIDTLTGLVFLYSAGSIFCYFLIQGYMKSVPYELIEAARIDGANAFSIYWRIVLPLIRPILVTVAVFQTMWIWNDFITPNVFLVSPGEEHPGAAGVQVGRRVHHRLALLHDPQRSCAAPDGGLLRLHPAAHRQRPAGRRREGLSPPHRRSPAVRERGPSQRRLSSTRAIPEEEEDVTDTIKAVINLDIAGPVISRHIYGHFAEHLGDGIHGGFYVGDDSTIPNDQGIRLDVVEALRQIAIPNLRWPGGCFADEYHWKDGIGPKEDRPSLVNSHWGDVEENNHFGTHEFMHLCELLDAEPYIAGNLGSGSVEEMSQWVEYLTRPSGSPMARLRRDNGREEPWRVKFWGSGQ